jgi:hypothetical protein
MLFYSKRKPFRVAWPRSKKIIFTIKQKQNLTTCFVRFHPVGLLDLKEIEDFQAQKGTKEIQAITGQMAHKGDTGPKGDQGAKGDQGLPGDPGNITSIPFDRVLINTVKEAPILPAVASILTGNGFVVEANGQKYICTTAHAFFAEHQTPSEEGDAQSGIMQNTVTVKVRDQQVQHIDPAEVFYSRSLDVAFIPISMNLSICAWIFFCASSIVSGDARR